MREMREMGKTRKWGNERNEGNEEMRDMRDMRACDSEEGGEAVENQNGLLKDVSRTDHQKVGRRVKPYG